ncbi:MAG TPA: cache domain-containing protein, partial [Anaeromyxobacter sp.]|nr:cache domain-containing protein [Anaeromyxobacter sp.]
MRTLATLLAAALLPAGLAGAAEKDPVAEAAASYAALEQADVELLSAELDRLVADPAFVGPFLARDRARLLAAARPVFQKLGAEKQITHWYFIEPEPSRTCFLRVHAPEKFGDRIDRATLDQAIRTQKMGAGKELGVTAFALRVVKPIRSNGKVVGYMELGEEIGHFLGRMKQKTGDDYALLADKGRIDRKALAAVRKEDRWEEREDVVLIDSTV